MITQTLTLKGKHKSIIQEHESSGLVGYQLLEKILDKLDNISDDIHKLGQQLNQTIQKGFHDVRDVVFNVNLGA